MGSLRLNNNWNGEINNPDSGVIQCEYCGDILGYIETSEWLSGASCIECARKNNELDEDDEKRIKSLTVEVERN